MTKIANELINFKFINNYTYTIITIKIKKFLKKIFIMFSGFFFTGIQIFVMDHGIILGVDSGY